jgi:hypothetical protein
MTLRHDPDTCIEREKAWIDSNPVVRNAMRRRPARPRACGRSPALPIAGWGYGRGGGTMRPGKYEISWANLSQFVIAGAGGDNGSEKIGKRM